MPPNPALGRFWRSALWGTSLTEPSSSLQTGFFISCAGSLDYIKLCSVYRYGVFVIPNTVHDAFSHLLLTELVTASLFYASPKEETSENSGNVASQEGSVCKVPDSMPVSRGRCWERGVRKTCLHGSWLWVICVSFIFI